MVVKIREVLISDPVDPICAAILERHGLNVTCANRWPKDRLLKEIQVSIKYSFPCIMYCILVAPTRRTS